MNVKLNTFCLAMAVLLSLQGCSDQGTTGGATESGQGGSLSRFALSEDTLYVLSGENLQLLEVNDPARPILWSTIPVAFDVETLFVHGDNLFIGAASGVHIYDITDPLFPVQQSSLVHAIACDPVVVEGSTAYVTLRSNVGRCRIGSKNQLDIIDMTYTTDPRLIRSYPMQNPGGLAVKGGELFVCDGRAGLKRWDVTDPQAISVVETASDVFCHDIISFENRISVVGQNSLSQFDISQIPMKELSVIQTRDGG